MDTITRFHKFIILLFLINILLFPKYIGGFLDIEELKSANYEIDILDTPITINRVIT